MLVLKGELVRNGENILLSLFKIMIKEMCLLFQCKQNKKKEVEEDIAKEEVRRAAKLLENGKAGDTDEW